MGKVAEILRVGCSFCLPTNGVRALIKNSDQTENQLAFNAAKNVPILSEVHLPSVRRSQCTSASCCGTDRARDRERSQNDHRL